MSNTLGNLIKKHRVELNMSLKKLGDECGISDSEILKIESGKRKKPSWTALCKIAKALSLHPFELLSAAGYISESDISPQLKLQKLNYLYYL